MIVFDDSFVAYLGGPYGDTLSYSRDAGPFEEIASFGIDEEKQAAKQRRLLLHGETVFVLEPEESIEFDDGPLRVRRFDRSGATQGEEVGPGEEGRAQLASRSHQAGESAPWIVSCFGVDPERGVPLRWSRELPTRWKRRPWTRRGSPVWRGDTLFVPVSNALLLEFSGDQCREHRLKPGIVQLLGERVLAVGHRDDGCETWLDGVRSKLPRPPLWPHLREYQGPAAVERDDGSLVFLRAHGGGLPSLGGAPGRLPPGLYDGLVRLAGGVFGVEIERGPRLVRAEL
jgi:hypothetical protein